MRLIEPVHADAFDLRKRGARGLVAAGGHERDQNSFAGEAFGRGGPARLHAVTVDPLEIGGRLGEAGQEHGSQPVEVLDGELAALSLRPGLQEMKDALRYGGGDTDTMMGPAKHR